MSGLQSGLSMAGKIGNLVWPLLCLSWLRQMRPVKFAGGSQAA